MKKWFLVFVVCLVACATRQPSNGTAIDDMNVTLHQGMDHNHQTIRSDDQQANAQVVSQALMPEIRFRSTRRIDSLHRRFDVAVKDEPANAFFTGLVLNTPISMVVSPKIKGKITLSLKQVTVEQVLQALEDTYDYTYNRIPGGYEVLPNTLQTQLFSVDYLELTRESTSDMKLHSGELTDVVSSTSSTTSAPGTGGGSTSGSTSTPGSIGSVTTTSKVDFWSEIERTVRVMVGLPAIDASAKATGAGGAVPAAAAPVAAPAAGIASSQPGSVLSDVRDVTPNVVVNKLAGVVVVRAYTKELKKVRAYLDMVQKNTGRQVMLEAKILEVTLNDQYQGGIDWTVLGAQLNAIGDFPNTTITVSDFPANFHATIDWNKKFTTYIQLLETQGNVQILSSPRVSAMNNQKSLIKVGTDEFYVSGIAPGQSSLGAVAQPTETISPFFTGITLDVTPQINRNGNVTLHVHPAISLVTEQIKNLIVGTPTPQPVPLAQSTIRESDTVVHAQNGQVVIIGGLMQNQTNESIAQLPFFGNVPFLGTLFRATKQTSQKTELVILIKATVMNRNTVNRDLMQSVDELASLKRGFHFGARPDIYGNEGEVPIVTGPAAGDYKQPRKKRCRNGVCS